MEEKHERGAGTPREACGGPAGFPGRTNPSPETSPDPAGPEGGFLIRLLRAISPDCKAASRLQALALDELSLLQRLGLRIHLLLCAWCRRYGRHVRFLREAVNLPEESCGPDATLPGDARERIRGALHNAEK